MKKTISLIVSVLMLITLAACSSSADKDSESYLKAVVVSTADGTVKVSANGTEPVFSVKELASVPALEAGDKVVLTYTGTLKDGDASGAKLTAIELIAVTKPEPEPEQPAQSEEVLPDYTKTATFYGMLKNVSMNSFTVLNGNGKSADFSINQNSVFSTADGLFEGIMVTVTYTGNYKNSAECTVISVVEDANNVTPSESETETPSSSTAPVKDASSIEGIVSEVSRNNLVLETKSVGEIVFFLDANTSIKTDGEIALGKSVTVVYTGKLDGNNANSCTVISVS